MQKKLEQSEWLNEQHCQLTSHDTKSCADITKSKDLYVRWNLKKPEIWEYEAQIKALESLRKNYDIDFWEVE